MTMNSSRVFDLSSQTMSAKRAVNPQRNGRHAADRHSPMQPIPLGAIVYLAGPQRMRDLLDSVDERSGGVLRAK